MRAERAAGEPSDAEAPYPWAVVGSQDPRYLWFLERTPGTITPSLRDKLLRRLVDEFGYPSDIGSRMLLTPPNPDIVRHTVVDGDEPSKAWPRPGDPTYGEHSMLSNAQSSWRALSKSMSPQ